MEINKAYERLLNRIKNGSVTQINKAFRDMIFELTHLLNTSKNLNPKTNKLIKKRISEIRRAFTNEYNSILFTYENSAISLSERKNIVMISKAIEGLEVESELLKLWIGRPETPKIKTVSKRVWNITKGFYEDLNNILETSLLEGQSANTVKKQLTRLLNNPETLDINELRRAGFKKAGGEVEYRKLEKKIINRKVGRGVYRSSKKNAYRLAREEINRAYRSEDNAIRQRLPFVLGTEVKLSTSHPREDICDDMQGKYPKDYNFIGWHTACICYQVPILATKEQTAKLIANIPVKTNPVKTIPKRASKYINERKAKIKKLKTTPFFIQENKKYFKGI